MSDEPPDYADYRIDHPDGGPQDLEWIGVTGGGHDPRPRLYDPGTGTAYKGELDHERERVVVTPDGGRDLGQDGLAMEVAVIDDWEWLSPFAREHADD